MVKKYTSNEKITLTTNREKIVNLINDVSCRAYDGRNALQQSKNTENLQGSSEDPAKLP